MAATHLSGPLYVGGNAVVTQDPLTRELVAPLPIVYPPGAGVSLVPDGDFVSIAGQTGGPSVDVPRNVLFGPGGVTPSGILSIAPDGVATVLQSAALVLSARLRVVRTGAPGTAVVVIWGEVSNDGGVNWAQLPNVSAAAVRLNTEATIFTDLIPVLAVAGQKYRLRFARSSDGTNFGDLAPLALPGGLSFLGTIPSARLAVYRFA